MGRTTVLPGLSCSSLLLFFTLVMLHSALTRAAVQRSLSIEEEELEEGMKSNKPPESLQWLRNNYKALIGMFGGFIPILGTAVIKSVELVPEADKFGMIHSEINALNARLDILYEELKWGSGGFQLVVNNIENAWLKYEKMVNKKELLDNIFVPFYSQFVDSVLFLNKLLTPDPEENTQSLGDILAKKLRCHEADVEAKFANLISLVCKANTMDEVYYKLKLPNNDRTEMSQTIGDQSSLALFKAHQRCVSNSLLYILRDIIERTNPDIIKQETANNIVTFLQKTYDRYEWLVVTYTTHNSKKTGKWNKRHILKGFSEIQRGPITVAVAGRLKGSNTKTERVREVIKNCVPPETNCRAVYETIEKCDKDVFKDQKLPQMISALHVYTGTGSQSYTKGPHVYIGECAGNDHFSILIKSDELIDGKSLCRDDYCKRGTCEEAPITKAPICKCPYPYYGPRCEKSLENCGASLKRPASLSNIVASIVPEESEDTDNNNVGPARSIQRSKSLTSDNRPQRNNAHNRPNMFYDV